MKSKRCCVKFESLATRHYGHYIEDLDYAKELLKLGAEAGEVGCKKALEDFDAFVKDSRL